MNQLVLTCPSQFLLWTLCPIKTKNVQFDWKMSDVQALFQAPHYVCMYIRMCKYVVYEEDQLGFHIFIYGSIIPT